MQMFQSGNKIIKKLISSLRAQELLTEYCEINRTSMSNSQLFIHGITIGEIPP